MFFLSALCLSKTPMVGSKRFHTRISKSPYSFVLFTTRGCGECDKILSVMDNLYDKFTGRVSMLSVDIDVSPDLKKLYNVKEVPSIGVFSGDRFLHFYRGECDIESIFSYCESFFTVSDIDQLSNVFDIFEYQKEKTPANLIISDKNLLDKAKKIAPLFPGTLNIAYVENTTAAQLAGIKRAQISRPTDLFKEELEDINEDNMKKFAKPMIEIITNQEQLGNSPTKHTLIALLDEKDPLQKGYIAEMWNNVSNLYGGNLSYQFCDFYRCTDVIQKMGILNLGNPLFILSSNVGIRAKLQVLPNPEPTQTDLTNWLNKNVLGIEEPEERNDDGVPRLKAHQFMRIVLDPKRDVVLLMAHPGMNKYKEAKENAKALIEIFQNVRGIDVYEFNPRTELVPGLQMPKTEQPMFSVWPATDGSTGHNFMAAEPLPFIVDQIMQIAETKIDPTMFKQIGEMINEFMRNKAK